MTDRIFIYMPSDQTEVDWLIASGQDKSSARSGHDALAKIAPLCSDRQVVLVVPGNSTTLCTVTLPVSNKKQLLKAIPYALEEQLVEDVESLHFAVGKQDANKATPVAVTRQKRMKNWVAVLDKHGISPEIIIPDTLLLPLKRKEWSAVIQNHSMNVRTGKNTGFSCDDTNATFMLQTALAENGNNKPERINLFLADNAIVPENMNELDIEIIKHSAGNNPLGILSGNINGSAVINLMQGTFVSKESGGGLLKPWKPALIAGVILLLLHIGSNVGQYFYLNNEYNKLDTEITQLYQQLFPGSKKIKNIRSLVQSKLKALGASNTAGSNGFVNLLARTGDVLHKIPGLEIKNINYRNKRMEMEVILNDLQTLEKVKNNLADTGLMVEIQSASAKDNKVTTRLKIEGAS